MIVIREVPTVHGVDLGLMLSAPPTKEMTKYGWQHLILGFTLHVARTCP